MKRKITLTESQFNRLVKNCVKKALKEAEEGADQVMLELAEEIGVDVSDLTETDYHPYGNCRSFECSDGSEYLTYNSLEDAYEGAVEWNKSLIEDEKSLPNLNIENYLDEDWVDELATEEADYMTENAIEEEEITEDEKDSYWQERYDEVHEDPLSTLKGVYGKEVGKYLLNQGALDVDTMARDCVDIDGVAHALASYDGEEIELPCGAYAYRVN